MSLTYRNVLPVLSEMFSHGSQELPVLLCVCEILLVVGWLQNEIGHIHNTNYTTTCPGTAQKALSSSQKYLRK